MFTERQTVLGFPEHKLAVSWQGLPKHLGISVVFASSSDASIECQSQRCYTLKCTWSFKAILPWLRQPLAQVKTTPYTLSVGILWALFCTRWSSKCGVQDGIILAWLFPCVVGKLSHLTCWQEMYQGLLCRKMFSLVDHRLDNGQETYQALDLEKLLHFTANMPEIHWKNVSQSDFFGRNITIITSARNPTKINETIHFKSLLMWEHVYFTGTSGKSPLLPTKIYLPRKDLLLWS